MTVLVDIVFRGDIVSKKNIFEVQDALKARFKLKDAEVEKLFSGKPIVLKKGLSEEEAEKFRGLLKQLGALVDSRTRTVSSDEMPSEPSPVSESGGLSVSDVGADVLAKEDRSVFVPAEVDLSAMSLSPEGTDVLDDKDKTPFTPADIDTGHINLDADGE